MLSSVAEVNSDLAIATVGKSLSDGRPPTLPPRTIAPGGASARVLLNANSRSGSRLTSGGILRREFADEEALTSSSPAAQNSAASA